MLVISRKNYFDTKCAIQFMFPNNTVFIHCKHSSFVYSEYIIYTNSEIHVRICTKKCAIQISQVLAYHSYFYFPNSPKNNNNGNYLIKLLRVRLRGMFV